MELAIGLSQDADHLIMGDQAYYLYYKCMHVKEKTYICCHTIYSVYKAAQHVQYMHSTMALLYYKPLCCTGTIAVQ